MLLSYRQAQHRAILLDWGGTLTPAELGFYDQREEGGGLEVRDRAEIAPRSRRDRAVIGSDRVEIAQR